MKQATRRFIKCRPQAQVELVKHTPHSEGQYNECFQNAGKECERTPNTYIVSGWLVGQYDKHTDTTPIFHHFWNCDSDGNHYDTTPFRGSIDIGEYEYVSDATMWDECDDWSKRNDPKHQYWPPNIKMSSEQIMVNVCDEWDEKGLSAKYEWLPIPELQFTIGNLLALRKRVSEIKQQEVA